MANPEISVVVLAVGGAALLRHCLTALVAQLDPQTPDAVEIIVPYDCWSREVAALEPEFPAVRFHYYEDLAQAALATDRVQSHRLYERRRAIGLGLCRGRLVAMTEAQAVPAADWLTQIRAVHEQAAGIIGGAIGNRVDRPLNWAWYYSDFGRYGQPQQASSVDYLSDVNISYKREVLESVRQVWAEAYQEAPVHWALKAAGHTLLLDPRLLVFEQRPPMTLWRAFRERVEWGRMFAETRVAATRWWQRVLFLAGTPLLPWVLWWRVVRQLQPRQHTFSQIGSILLLVGGLGVCWSVGELLGYLAGPPNFSERQ